MTTDRPLTIGGWNPTRRAVVLLGMAIAIAMGAIALTVGDVSARLFHIPFVAPLVLLLLTSSIIFRPGTLDLAAGA